MARPIAWRGGVAGAPNVGTLAQRPPAGDGVYDMPFWATDTLQLFQCVETTAAGVFAWQEVTGTLPMPFASEIVYVSKAGSDTTGNGSFAKPFLTIQKALSTILDASTTKRYIIEVGPGSYIDPFQIKPWVALIGMAAATSGFLGITEISAPADTCGFDAAFATSGFSVSWYGHLVFSTHQTWDSILAGNNKIQLTYFDVNFNGGALYNGPGTGGVDNITWDNVLCYNGVKVKGWQFLFTIGGTQFLGGLIEVDSGPAGALESTTWLAQNTACGAAFNPTNVLVKWAAPSPVGFNAAADLSNCSIVGNVTVDGAHTSFTATVEGVPPNVSLINGAPTIVLQTFANGLGYTATGGAPVWGGVLPTNVQSAVDRIAAAVAGILGGPIP